MMKRQRLTEEQAAEQVGADRISARNRGIMYAMLLAFAFITLLTACGLSGDDEAGAQHMHGSETWETTSSYDQLPSFLSDYTPHTSKLYSEVHDHAHLMSGITCYCGCADGLAVETPHDSLLRCYLAEHPADEGSVTWTNHSTSCGICKKEMEDVIALSKQGKTIDEIREEIDAKYKPKKSSDPS
ncbi:PCYCGC domain-containing protein [Paenibacillus alkaliterrae]|uniref:PCYCGC domain-containing protein n=1 Tax=Paenibacillus alkaliterrae TaxID=320909 RepID=UPI001F21C78D|nr:PCYCGC domain-containing protein [Paenibacillus alkaliterrae]MCF2938811.1 PCYCGC domain-containing protein [Paenibacillus alkaliterrae]